MRSDFSLIKIDEGTTPEYTATVTDAAGLPVPLAQIGTLTLTLFDRATKAIINGRDDQNVLNANGVTVEATSGKLTWNMAPADTEILNAEAFFESRVAQFNWTYAGGTKVGSHEIIFTVRNLEKVT